MSQLPSCMLTLEKMKRSMLKRLWDSQRKGRVSGQRKLYGLYQIPRMFRKYLTKAIRTVGIQTSASDPCMFTRDRIIAVAFEDKILFWSTDEKYVNVLGTKLREQDLLLKEEYDADDFFGVTMDRNEDGSIRLKQISLTDQILEALGLATNMSTNKWT